AAKPRAATAAPGTSAGLGVARIAFMGTASSFAHPRLLREINKRRRPLSQVNALRRRPPRLVPVTPRTCVNPTDGFDVLDVHHRQTLFTLGKLAALVARLTRREADAEARAMAREIVEFFSTTAHPHHEDEERHVFPSLLASGDPQLVQAVLRLQQ